MYEVLKIGRSVFKEYVVLLTLETSLVQDDRHRIIFLKRSTCLISSYEKCAQNNDNLENGIHTPLITAELALLSTWLLLETVTVIFSYA